MFFESSSKADYYRALIEKINEDGVEVCIVLKINFVV